MIRVQREDFDPGAEMARVTADRTDIGGLACFVGLVRDFQDVRTVSALTLEHYPGMTEKQLAALEAEARQRWDLQDVVLIHRFGRMEPGEKIVLVIAASAHRQAALEACQFLIDWLKTKAPFWKLEDTDQGREWVEARAADETQAARWNQRT